MTYSPPNPQSQPPAPPPEPNSDWSPGLVMALLVTAIISLIGGGFVGGVAGYTVATYYHTDRSLPATQTSLPTASSADLGYYATDVPLTSLQSSPVSLPHQNEITDPSVRSVERVMPATVSVVNRSRYGEVNGSGVIIDAAGYIVTNYHVVDGAEQLYVVLSHGGQVPAQIVGLTDAYDLAVLKIDRSAVPAVAELGDSARLKQGQAVIAIGSALGDFRNTVTGGIISAHNRQLGELRGLLQTDAPINRGNSGGPLINLQGEVVGINVMVVRGNTITGATAEGLGFSIPANTVRRVVAQLIETGEVRVPYLGIFYEVLNPQMSMAHGLSVTEGVWLERVLPGTPAAQAGLRAGDVVLSFGGQAINDAYPLPELLLRYRVGDEVVINVLREGDNLEIPVKLGERPD